ncbi:MAG: ectoine/hydroxyectoine ABC transporter substrate-binding protein EhuB [Pseudonocardiaceae bacterium]|nr:ectoine/hydroxyectoine ABC transporter substrate-binding protein EhuB [Pseudonocardiaceae bacterium]
MTSSAWTRRDFLRRTAAAGGLAVGGSLLAGACSRVEEGGNALSSARESGTIRVGIAGEVPYGFTNEEGRVTGQAPEVARVVFGALGIDQVEAQQVEFDGLIPGLNARRFDVVSAGMFITPERCQQASFSIPDYLAPTAFLVPSGNPERVTRFTDIVEKRLPIAVLSGAVEGGYAEDIGVPPNQIQTLGDQVGMLQAVINQRAYAAVLTNISLNRLVEDNPDAGVEVTEGFFPVINGEEVLSAGGFVFRDSDNDLRTAFNEELRSAHQDGRWLEAARPFGFTEENLPPEDLTTEQLCQAPGG